MTQKARQDYVTLKEFSENASHEMQTPIAIAKGKLELLLESKDLEPEQLGLIQSAQEALSKLSKMGKSLSLLTKIENQEFSNQKPIDFSRAVASSIDFFSEISSFKGIQIETEIEPNVQVKIDESLADILIGNLMKNAIHHNFENGKIKVELDSDKLRITNSGLPPSIPTAQLFERFKKSDQTSQSLGLGLSIVKKICNVSDFKIRYDYENETHILQINF
jgi:signal transduction histidine kinase